MQYVVTGRCERQLAKSNVCRIFDSLEAADEFYKEATHHEDDTDPMWDDVRIFQANEIPNKAERETRDAAYSERGVENAGRYLELQGYEILERDYHTAHGVIDFICDDKNEDRIVIVTVKTRANAAAGFDGGDELDANQQRAWFEFVTADYLSEHPDVNPRGLRCDAITILVTSEHRAMVKHYIDVVNGF